MGKTVTYRFNPGTKLVRGHSRSLICLPSTGAVNFISNSNVETLQKQLPCRIQIEDLKFLNFDSMIMNGFILNEELANHLYEIEYKDYYDKTKGSDLSSIAFDYGVEGDFSINEGNHKDFERLLIEVLQIEQIIIVIHCIEKLENVKLLALKLLENGFKRVGIYLNMEKSSKLLDLIDSKFISIQHVKFIGPFITSGKYITSTEHSTIVDTNNFILDKKYFEWKRYRNSHVSSLYVQENGNVKISPNDRYIIKRLTSLQVLSDLKSSQEYMNMYEHTVDKRAKCSSCEFRYFCTNTLTNRKELDLDSAPTNCSYNPLIAKWEV